MYYYNIKISVRKLFRNRIYSIVNITGLVIGIVSSALIYNYIIHEYQTDRFHQGVDNVFRVLCINEYGRSVSTPMPMGPTLAEEFPSVINFARIQYLPPDIVDIAKDNKYFKADHIAFADLSLVELLNYQVITGDIQQIETGHSRVVISQTTAQNIFGNDNAVGQTLYMSYLDQMKDEPFTVTAVIQDVPSWSSIQFDYILDISEKAKQSTHWGPHSCELLVTLNSEKAKSSVEVMIPELYIKHGGFESSRRTQLQPYEDIYLHSDDINDPPREKGSIRFIQILAFIGLLIILLVAFNYLVLNTALFSRYISDIGIHKALGAGRRQLRNMIYADFFIHLLIASFLALFFTYLAGPVFNRIIDPARTISFVYNWYFLLAYLIILILVGLFLASILFNFISKLTPTQVMKSGIVALGRVNSWRRMLLITQMVVFCGLLLCTGVVRKQITFIKNKDLGFNPEQTMAISIPDIELIEVIKSGLDQSPYISQYTNGTSLPLSGKGTEKFLLPNEEELQASMLFGDHNYLKTYQIKLLEGNNLNPELFPQTIDDFFKSRSNRIVEVLVNERFVKQAQLKEPIGTLIKCRSLTARIVGVIKDVNHHLLYRPVTPMVLVYDWPVFTNTLVLRIEDGYTTKVSKFVGQIFENHFPDYPFHPFIYQYEQAYQKDIVLQRMINLFTVLAILLYSIGIFALSFFIAIQRTKEIGIRKVNGASVTKVMVLLNIDFVQWTIMALLIAFPLSYTLMNKWLENFAYKTTITWWLFGLIGICSLSIVILAISWQSWRAATRNPIESLRYE